MKTQKICLINLSIRGTLASEISLLEFSALNIISLFSKEY